MGGWIGVDLDGTLAVYRGWNGGAIGEPVERMTTLVREWIAEGQEVRIFTARVAASGLVNGQGVADDNGFAEAQRQLIGDWCEKHLGKRLKVTATKDLGMIELWDDRAVCVETNTGRPMTSDEDTSREIMANFVASAGENIYGLLNALSKAMP